MQEWGAVLPQYLGMAGLIFVAGFWAATGRLEPLLLSAFGGLIAAGQGLDALVNLKTAPPIPPPLPDTTVAPTPPSADDGRRSGDSNAQEGA